VKQNNIMIIIMNINKMANFSFLTIAYASSFPLILTSGPIITAKNHQRVVFSSWMPGFRCLFY